MERLVAASWCEESQGALFTALLSDFVRVGELLKPSCVFFELHDLDVRPDAGAGRLCWSETLDDGSTGLTVAELFDGGAAPVNIVEPPDEGTMEPTVGERSDG